MMTSICPRNVKWVYWSAAGRGVTWVTDIRFWRTISGSLWDQNERTPLMD